MSAALCASSAEETLSPSESSVTCITFDLMIDSGNIQSVFDLHARHEARTEACGRCWSAHRICAFDGYGRVQ